MTIPQDFDIKAELKKCKTADDLTGKNGLNSIKYVPYTCSKEFMIDLKDVYKASTEENAYQNLEKLQKKWELKYALAVRPWLVHWDNIKTLFALAFKLGE